MKGPVIYNIFNHPLAFDKKGAVKPEVIEKWQWNAKKKAYHFYIDKKYKYTNGKPVHPKDIELWLLRSLITSLDRPIFPVHESLIGTEKLKKGSPFKSGMCSCFKVISDSEFEIYIKFENSKFLQDLADYYPPLSPYDQFENDHFNYKGIPLGTGPYKITEYDKEKSFLKLELRNDGMYANATPQAPRYVDFYNSGNPDEIKPDVSGSNKALKWSKDIVRVSSLNPDTITMLNFNFRHKASKDINFRKAVSLAIDREKLQDEGSNRKPYYFLNLNQELGLKEPKRNFDRKTAKEIVEKYFKTLSSPEKKLKAAYYSAKDASQKPFIYREIEKQLAQIGLYVEFSPNDHKPGSESKLKDVVIESYGKVLPFNDYLYAFLPYSHTEERPFSKIDPADKRYINYYKKAIRAPTESERLKWGKKLADLHVSTFT